MSRKIYIIASQPDPEGPAFGPVMDPNDFMKSQDYGHDHVTQVVKDFLVANAPGAQVAGFGAALTSGLGVSIAKGTAVSPSGVCYDTDQEDDSSSVVTMAAAHVSLPRIDLVIATLAIDTPVGSEFKPHRRLRTQPELEANVAPYPPNQIEVPTELHTRAVISVKTGTPNASPAAPVADAGEVALWEIHVAASQVTLGGGDLTDVRPRIRSLYQLAADVEGAELLAHKGQASGYAELDSSGKLPLARLQYTPVNRAGDVMGGPLSMPNFKSLRLKYQSDEIHFWQIFCDNAGGAYAGTDGLGINAGALEGSAGVVALFIKTDGEVSIPGRLVVSGGLRAIGLPVYANNAAAVAGGLTAGTFYRTGGDPDIVAVVH
jgi:hypothetical protein